MTNEDLLYSTGNSAQCSVMAYMGQNVKKRKSHVIYKISGVRIASELSKQNKKHLHWKLESKRTMLLKFCGKWIFFPEVLFQQGYHISNKQKHPGTFSLEGSKQFLK